MDGWMDGWMEMVYNYGDPPEKFGTLRPAFQGHSRSPEPTRIDRVLMISYQRSISTRGLSCTVCKI